MSVTDVRSDPEYSAPGKSLGLFDLGQYRYLLSLLIRKGISTRYYGSALGWIWSYLRPAAQFLMYYFVIGILLGADRGMKFFPIYLFAGIVTVNLFAECLRTATDSVTANASLIKKVYLPRELFPVAAVAGAFIHFLPQAVLLLVICIFLGWTFSWLQLAALILGLVLVMIFALGLGMFFGAINVAFRDARNVVDIILMFSTWASPVLYTFTLVRDKAPSWLFEIYMVNPVTSAVELFHEVFWMPIEQVAERPPLLWSNSFIGLGVALLTLVIGQLVFRRLEGNFAQHL